MEKIINITVRNRIAFADPAQSIICGNEDYTAVFDFDEEWNDIETKTARFYRKGIYTDVIFTGNEVKIPEMVNVFSVQIGVFAGDVTTTPANVRCYKSILCDGGNVAEPEPDVYAQIIEMLENIGGASIESIEQTTTSTVDGGINIMTVTLSDGTTSTFTVRNGTRGSDGIPPHIGDNGNWFIGEIDTGMPSRGEAGATGAAGYSPTVSISKENKLTTVEITTAQGKTYARIADGQDGVDGKAGADGKTPVKGVDYFDGQPGKDGNPGQPGADGISPTVAISKSGKVTTISITDRDGVKTATVNDGADGSPGAAGSNGKDGTSVTVSSVSESTADGGSNVVTFSDGKTLTVKNGGKGSTGATGAAGKDGKTPIRGVDYYTEADQEAIVQQVLTAMSLNVPVFGVVDENNNIVLTGELAEGTYAIKYEDSDGGVIDIGTLGISSGPRYTNLLPTSVDNTGAVYNGTGFKNGCRLTGGTYPCEAADDAYFCTGYIPYTKEQASARVPMYVKGVTIDLANVPKYLRVAMVDAYNTTDGYIDTLSITGSAGAANQITIQQLGDQYYKLTPNSGFISGNFDDWKNKDLQFIRWSFPGTGDGVIFTVGEPIE